MEFSEAIAIQKGLELATEIGLTPPIVESYVMNVVNLIESNSTSRIEVGRVIYEVKDLFLSKNPFKVNYVPRSSNEAAITW